MTRATILVFSLALLSAPPLAGDTIRLKNGKIIRADTAVEKNGKIEYTIGDDTYAISKALVERIESGGAPLSYSGGSAAPRGDIPVPTLREEMKGSQEAAGRIIHDGAVDEEVIRQLEKAQGGEQASAAWFAAGQFEDERGNTEKARAYYEHALSYTPDNSALLNHYVRILIQSRRPADAQAYAERSLRLAPNSADALTLLGFVYFETGRTQQAIPLWKRSLGLRPDSTVQHYLAMAEREQAAESSFDQQETGHFLLRYEGKQTPEALRGEILRTLEADYNELVVELGVAPKQTISVSLYTDQAFFDVTQAPGWTAAVNDGKLRIPTEGLTGVTSELARVLKHELAHSFINQITHGRCPQWLNEGVAQAVEPRTLGGNGRVLAQLYGGQRQIPLSTLEGSWFQFSGMEASIAYAEALAAVEYIRNTYGMDDVQRLLQRIGDGASTESALRTTIHAGYSDMEDEIGAYLKKSYGP